MKTQVHNKKAAVQSCAPVPFYSLMIQRHSAERHEDNLFQQFHIPFLQMIWFLFFPCCVSGIAGDWKNQLTVAEAEYFDSVYKDKMKDVKCKFVWDLKTLNGNN